MNGTGISIRNRLTTLRETIGVWIIEPIIYRERGAGHSYRSLKCKMGGGLFSFTVIAYINPTHSGLQLCVGIFVFHLDLDLMFIVRPEDEFRNDKQTNKVNYNDGKLDHRSWFIGYEGIGIYRKYSMVGEYGISQLEVGASPLCGIALTNIYHPITQRVVVGIQFANLQVCLHSVIDENL
jgi:hypothetical protein